MFDSMDCLINPNSNPKNHHYPIFDPVIDSPFSPTDFQLWDYLILNDGSSSQSTMVSSDQLTSGGDGGGDGGATSRNGNNNNKWKKGVMNKDEKLEMVHRVAFRTKSDLEIMDDGFKWRKYGKKSVKNSPNPRNYYKCSSGDCNVKKRVERDREDSKYVITTYEGIHNHQSPSLVYYKNGWNLQTSSPSSSS
ncbi:probable WRKY transcription factor 51 [Mercurialis annua]|uniref:probable WRKY transcription factor 51 n=1 Tax=Mercurialis annua TaxID=3986 RepID=UPI00215E5C37|nr:probable WRKY transcription factor 51 [Mercurialis annua]XP_055959656.1 probable WRKY transcription factor 51 [Mercurialis annua]XP_055959657.1 probable WRKY transcription factor 51 [Mercurialis annua]XP_055959658.1 probable WRKY transcription factor 51 [Mercurialis annua]XP_055959659.1 probable WRKY transcription factor 51 [Mercurialis annua]